MNLAISSFVLFCTLSLSPFAALAKGGEPPATQASVIGPATQKAADESWRPISVDMTLSPTALDMTGCGAKGVILYLNGMHLTDIKPAAIIKEPKYLSKPYYGAFKVGSGSVRQQKRCQKRNCRP